MEESVPDLRASSGTVKTALPVVAGAPEAMTGWDLALGATLSAERSGGLQRVL